MPVLRSIRERLADERPLDGITVAACLHVTAETANLVRALIAGGAEVALCAANPLSTQDETAAALAEDFGAEVHARRGEDAEAYAAHVAACARRRPHVTLDDGADLVMVLHHARARVRERLIGGTEETTTGLLRVRALEAEGRLTCPVIAVNEAHAERIFNDHYGTGQSALDGILRATNILLAGQTFVIFGYGWTGRGLAQRARGAGAQVVICEVDPVRALEARMEGFEVMPALEAAARGDVFVTVTGSRAVLRREHFERMKDGAILANAGHFDVEIDLDALRAAAVEVRDVLPLVQQYDLGERRLNLLASGRVVNLAAGQGHPAAVMDMSFALQALVVEDLVARGARPGAGRAPGARRDRPRGRAPEARRAGRRDRRAHARAGDLPRLLGMSLLVGASGFSFASWRPGFYPAGTRNDDFLRFYAGVLSTVEVNSSFYRLPSAETFERWAATVPDGFRFAVKMPRAITVYGRVDDAPAFCERVRALGDRLGPLLVRPADDRKRDDGFLRALLDGIDDDLWPAFDLRHPSWDGVEELLEGRDAVRVNQLDAPAPFRYLRLREPPYDDAALGAWADRLRPLLDDGVAVHCYFRHEDEPTAPAYARRLLELVDAADGGPRGVGGAARRGCSSGEGVPARAVAGASASAPPCGVGSYAPKPDSPGRERDVPRAWPAPRHRRSAPRRRRRDATAHRRHRLTADGAAPSRRGPVSAFVR